MDNFKNLILEAYSDKDESVIKNNIESMSSAFDYIKELDNDNLTISEDDNNEQDDLYNKLNNKSNNIKVSDFLEHKDGMFDGGTSSSDKRKISSKVPKWIKENCIECNQCSFICPH